MTEYSGELTKAYARIKELEDAIEKMPDNILMSVYAALGKPDVKTIVINGKPYEQIDGPMTTLKKRMAELEAARARIAELERQLGSDK
jgi:hypothetical protein